LEKLEFVNHRNNLGRFDGMKLSQDLFAIFNATNEFNNMCEQCGQQAFYKFFKEEAPKLIEELLNIKEVKHSEFKIQKYLYGHTFQHIFWLCYNDDATGEYIFNLNWFIKPIAGN
jgi:hypothetical protein